VSDVSRRITRPPATGQRATIAPVDQIPDYARAAVSLRAAARMLTTRTDAVKRLIDSGDIAAFRDGRAWRVSTDSIRTYVATRAAEYVARAGMTIDIDIDENAA
jgi:excisionase family DNA binding protein